MSPEAERGSGGEAGRTDRHEVVIVGAGFTGLLLGYFLEGAGVDHVVLEAAPRPGGVIRTSVNEGRILEHGPQRVRLDAGLLEVVRSLGLEGELVRVPPERRLFIRRRGELHPVPTSLSELLRTRLLSPRARLRLLGEPFTRGPLEGETVGGYFSRKVGREAARNLVGPLFGGLYGSDPDEMYVRHALAPTLRRLGVSRSLLARLRSARSGRGASPSVSFRRGMESLVEALHRHLGDRVRTSVRVRSAARSGDDWVVEADELGSPPTSVAVRGSSLVVTAPADVTSELFARSFPDLSSRLARLRYNPLRIVHLFAPGPGPEGLGYQVAPGEGLRTRGVTFNASALGRDGVYTAFLGGSTDPEATDLPPAEAGEIARRELEVVTGVRARVLGSSRARMPAWDATWCAIDGLGSPPGLHLCTNYLSRPGLPGRLAAARSLATELARER